MHDVVDSFRETVKHQQSIAEPLAAERQNHSGCIHATVTVVGGHLNTDRAHVGIAGGANVVYRQIIEIVEDKD